jgi:Tol biopolymer transport system component
LPTTLSAKMACQADLPPVTSATVSGLARQSLATAAHEVNGRARPQREPWNSHGQRTSRDRIRGLRRQLLFRVPETGGTMVPVTALASGDVAHMWPQFLPDGHHFLYMRISNDANQMGVYVGSIDVKPEEQSLKRLLATNDQAYFAPSAIGGPGHLIFLRDTTLMAQPFDPFKMALSGEPVPIAEGVDSYAGARYGLFSVSETGTIVYREGAGSQVTLTWLDQRGSLTGTAGEPGEYANPAVSPDGARVAVSRGPVGSRDIWIVDVRRNITNRLTFDPADDAGPVWSPDGTSIVFSSNRTGQARPYIKPADGSGEERLLTDQAGTATSWSKDRRFLLFTSRSPKTGEDIWVLRDPGGAAGTVRPVPVLATPFDEEQAQLSPDGCWIAYVSNESGTYEIYVRPFSPDGNTRAGAKWLVSKGVVNNPRWSADGKQLFYGLFNNSGAIMAVDIDTSRGFHAGTPRQLFNARSSFHQPAGTGWDVAPDNRFLFLGPPNPGRIARFNIVLNWQAGLKR